MHRSLTLLGPQRHRPTLASVFDELGLDGPIAAVTAGWQEREAEVEEMRTHLGRPVVNLLLHFRGEQLFAADPRFAAAYRARQERLRRLQELYRLRLDPTVGAARKLFQRRGDPELLVPERRSAVAAVRALDSHHLRRIRRLHREFEERFEPHRRPSLDRHRHELRRLLEGTAGLAIAGGHVAVLLNRLRLFGVLELAPELPVVAWSAGAMALAEKVVLFHDSPPQGAGNAEVLEAGLGLFDDVLPLPHASKRLRLADPVRVALLARRFAPAVPVALDGEARLVRRAGEESWRPAPGTRRLTPRGRVAALEAPE